MTTIINLFRFLAFTPFGHILLYSMAGALAFTMMRHLLRALMQRRRSGARSSGTGLTARAPRRGLAGSLLMAPFTLLLAPGRLFLLTGKVLYWGVSFVVRHIFRLTRRPHAARATSLPSTPSAPTAGLTGRRAMRDRLSMRFRRNHLPVLDHMVEKLRANNHIVTPWEGMTLPRGRTSFTTTCVSCASRMGSDGVEMPARALTIVQQDRFDGTFAYIVEDPTGLLTSRCNATFVDTDAIFGGGLVDADGEIGTGTPYVVVEDDTVDPLDGSPEASVS